MSRTDAPRPPAPHPAERARSIAALGGRATLVPAADQGQGDRVVPMLHHVHADGSVSVLLPEDHELVATAWQAPRGELATMVELADTAPVPLREPVRGLLWITGWLRALGDDEARAQAVLVAEERPDPRLLDLGHGAALLRLVPASLVLADAEGTHSVAVPAFTQAEPDPFVTFEAGWLRHLELSHTDVVGSLVRHLPEDLRGGHVRPLGLDRFGLRLRVEAIDADHDVRLAFSRPVSDPSELSAELRRLVGCPFLASRHTG
ncbi:DUF2470 domain-containing protein [Actinokineospora globicatena]|uniref:DUF2470 domain-containing protein n=1 Tax=Actinokineospora globicatena TaxID=103729 RepID=A0A9W6QLU6_9PSEU|nr:DUF2470 domain-containing protein [Actinokineospora globicatena]MCP2301167.1 Protein of unknown function (DUF2470) [Actinokineospora globicatena]GLW77197.1 hypothetical protein Aglo01_16790 [Actinokineospora globicatena]GLW84031.1 hypothetical protein Aglo02_16710 [Actinokineospora globicatena]GLW92025.1 hypothetical protein Aglo03_28410 [Actinokineospora globicatena]